MSKHMKHPVWVKDMIRTWRGGVSNFFILSGNVYDYAITDILLYDYLTIELKRAGFSAVMELSASNQTLMMESERREISVRSASSSMFTRSGDHPIAIIVRNPELLYPDLPPGYGQAHLVADFSATYDALTSKEFLNSKNMLIFITESKNTFNQRFLSAHARGHLIDVDFPGEEIRHQFILDQCERYPVVEASGVTPKVLARATAGLTLVGIEDVILRAKMDGEMRLETVKERKNELIRKEYGNVIEVMDAEGFSFKDYAGQDHLKEYHRDVIITPMLQGDLELVPKGLLYTGPPGTGKTHFARCLAGEAGMNFVELKPSQLHDQWVGNSEKNFAKALACIRSIAPVGVFIDEIDQAFRRGGNDTNGVAGNFFSMFLTILSEPKNRGRIVWIAATNYPNKLDEALKRTGRLDKKMPFLPPEEADRKTVLRLYLDKSRLGHSISEGEMDRIARNTERYTHAEIEGLVVKAAEVAGRRKKESIEEDDMRFAMDCVVRHESAALEEMTQLAIKECNDWEFLPERYRH